MLVFSFVSFPIAVNTFSGLPFDYRREQARFSEVFRGLFRALFALPPCIGRTETRWIYVSKAGRPRKEDLVSCSHKGKKEAGQQETSFPLLDSRDNAIANNLGCLVHPHTSLLRLSRAICLRGGTRLCISCSPLPSLLYDNSIHPSWPLHYAKFVSVALNAAACFAMSFNFKAIVATACGANSPSSPWVSP